MRCPHSGMSSWAIEIARRRILRAARVGHASRITPGLRRMRGGESSNLIELPLVSCAARFWVLLTLLPWSEGTLEEFNWQHKIWTSNAVSQNARERTSFVTLRWVIFMLACCFAKLLTGADRYEQAPVFARPLHAFRSLGSCSSRLSADPYDRNRSFLGLLA